MSLQVIQYFPVLFLFSLDLTVDAQGTKTGFCPINYPPNGATSCVLNDYACPGAQKCCQVGSTLFSYCADPTATNQWVTKPGVCPATVTTTSATCVADSQCPHLQKCCFSGASSFCTNPGGSGSTATTKAGFCGRFGAGQVVGTCAVECASDFSCFGTDKCCFNGCGRSCRPAVGLGK